jgi:hypothetical protein
VTRLLELQRQIRREMRQRNDQQERQNEMGSLLPFDPDTDSSDQEQDAFDLLFALI